MDKLKHALAYGAVGFKIFPIAPGTKNRPLCKWATEATTDPKQITKWWTQYPKANIGFAAGLSGYAVVDVDTKDDRNGFETLKLLEVIDGHTLPETRMQRTPSGGRQYILKGELATTQNAIGKHHYTGDDVSNIDTRGVGGSGGGYVLLPPSMTADDPTTHTKRGMYEWINGANHNIAPVPEWLIEECGQSRISNSDQAFVVEPDQQSNINDYIHYLQHDAPPSIEGQGGERTLLLVAAQGKDFGLSEEKTAELINEYYNLDILDGGKCDPIWNLDERGPDSMLVKVSNAYEYCHEIEPGSATGEAVFGDDVEESKELEREAKAKGIGHDGRPNIESTTPRPTDGDGSPPQKAADKWEEDFLAMSPEQTVQERFWSYAELRKEWIYVAATSRFMLRSNPDIALKKETFDDLVAYTVAGRSKPQKRPSHYLFNETGPNAIKRAMRPVYRPGSPSLVMGDGMQDFNIYRPSTIVPNKGDTRLWNAHLEYLFPDIEQRAYVLNWCGWLLQNINKKPKHALLLSGYSHGTGKSFIADTLTTILGKHNAAHLETPELTSAFNRWALGSKLLVIEELSGLGRREIQQKLHSLITQETCTINDKGVPTFAADTCFGIFATTNEDAAISLDNRDRRYLVVRTYAEPKDQAYYESLFRLQQDPVAVAAIAYELMHRDLGAYNAQARAPDTEAKRDMVQLSRTDFQVWLDSMRDTDPFNRDLISVQHDIVSIIDPRFGKVGMNTGLHREIVKFLRHDMGMVQHRYPDRLSNGRKVRLWMRKKDYDGILGRLSGPDRVRRYEAKAKTERNKAETESAKDFGDAAE